MHVRQIVAAIFGQRDDAFPNNYVYRAVDNGDDARTLVPLKPFTNPMYDVYGPPGVALAAQASPALAEGALPFHVIQPTVADVKGFSAQMTGDFTTQGLLDLQAMSASYQPG